VDKYGRIRKHDGGGSKDVGYSWVKLEARKIRQDRGVRNKVGGMVAGRELRSDSLCCKRSRGG
jgi:hypothetical protein